MWKRCNWDGTVTWKECRMNVYHAGCFTGNQIAQDLRVDHASTGLTTSKRLCRAEAPQWLKSSIQWSKTLEKIHRQAFNLPVRWYQVQNTWKSWSVHKLLLLLSQWAHQVLLIWDTRGRGRSPKEMRTSTMLSISWNTSGMLMELSKCCNIQGGPKKTAQSSWHYNFATVHHRVMWFSAKCSERNSLHD